jgi:hypothetical protein
MAARFGGYRSRRLRKHGVVAHGWKYEKPSETVGTGLGGLVRVSGGLIKVDEDP